MLPKGEKEGIMKTTKIINNFLTLLTLLNLGSVQTQLTRKPMFLEEIDMYCVSFPWAENSGITLLDNGTHVLAYGFLGNDDGTDQEYLEFSVADVLRVSNTIISKYVQYLKDQTNLGILVQEPAEITAASDKLFAAFPIFQKAWDALLQSIALG